MHTCAGRTHTSNGLLFDVPDTDITKAQTNKNHVHEQYIELLSLAFCTQPNFLREASVATVERKLPCGVIYWFTISTRSKQSSHTSSRGKNNFEKNVRDMFSWHDSSAMRRAGARYC